MSQATGFAGTRCIVHLSDGRLVYAAETQEDIEQRVARLSPAATRFPTLPIKTTEGTRRWISPAHIVEYEPLEPDDGRS